VGKRRKNICIIKRRAITLGKASEKKGGGGEDMKLPRRKRRTRGVFNFLREVKQWRKEPSGADKVGRKGEVSFVTHKVIPMLLKDNTSRDEKIPIGAA